MTADDLGVLRGEKRYAHDMHFVAIENGGTWRQILAEWWDCDQSVQIPNDTFRSMGCQNPPGYYEVWTNCRVFVP